MLAQITVFTLSGFRIKAFADMPDSLFEELSGDQIWTEMLPLSLREGWIPNNLKCILHVGDEIDAWHRHVLGGKKLWFEKKRPAMQSRRFFRMRYTFGRWVSNLFSK